MGYFSNVYPKYLDYFDSTHPLSSVNWYNFLSFLDCLHSMGSMNFFDSLRSADSLGFVSVIFLDFLFESLRNSDESPLFIYRLLC